MENNMKSFKDLREGTGPVKYDHARKWVFHRLQNTDHTHDQMKKDFHKKFGKQSTKHFDRAVSEYMD